MAYTLKEWRDKLITAQALSQEKLKLKEECYDKLERLNETLTENNILTLTSMGINISLIKSFNKEKARKDNEYARSIMNEIATAEEILCKELEERMENGEL